MENKLRSAAENAERPLVICGYGINVTMRILRNNVLRCHACTEDC